MRSEAAAIDKWVVRHVGEYPFLKVGGESMKVAKRTIVAAMIYHLKRKAQLFDLPRKS